jgi:histone deacetylase complex regulatory component SIN3
MNSIVLNHLLTEEKMTEKVALQIARKLERHPDILEEFIKWLQTKQYPVHDAIRVEGYTAQTLSDSTYLHPVGSYNYLIYLREKPEEALCNLKQGLPRK